MCYSYVAPVAGILLVGPVGKSTTATESPEHSEDAEIEPASAVSQRRERTHASMKTNKESDLQGTEATAPTLDTTHTMEEPLTVSEVYERFRRPIHSYIFR